MPFYPNECFVCGSGNSIKRCSRCNMISYCGKNHQKDHWPDHKEICDVISAIMQEKGVLHLFENLRGANSLKWKQERDKACEEIKSRLGRPLISGEKEIFQYPRACYICHDTRQEMLKNCPNCTWTSFCTNHPRSSLHDKDCALIRYCHKLEIHVLEYKHKINAAIDSILGRIRVPKSLKPPSSMKEFLDENIDSELGIPVEAMAYVTDFCSNPLTIFNALLKLSQIASSEMVIHVSSELDTSTSWELLLHLLPGLKILKVVVVNQKNNFSQEMKVCGDCGLAKKRLMVQNFSGDYSEFLASRKLSEEDKANIVLNVNLSSEEDVNKQVSWGLLTCPLVVTTETEKNASFVKASLRCTFWGSLICYVGDNEFKSLRPRRDSEDGGIRRSNQYLIVYKGPEGGEKLTDLEKNSPEKREAFTIDELEKIADKMVISKANDKPKSGLAKSSGIKSYEDFKAKKKVRFLEPSLETIKVELTPGIFTQVVKSQSDLDAVSQELLKQNWLLQEENRFLKGRIGLNEQHTFFINEQLKTLKNENEKLKQENLVIKNLRQGIEETILSVIKNK